jgi:hypothetical protein
LAGGWWLEWTILLWAAGMLLVSGRLILGLIAMWRLGRRSSMVTDGGWLHLAHDIAHSLGARRGVTLLRGQEGNVPMTWGVLRPVIWLPIDAGSWTEDRRRAVLAHELAHVRRADALTQWVGHVATVLFWFNPLVWIAVRRLRDERERACDDAVIRLGTPSVRYADHLLDVARTAGRRPTAYAAMAMARHSPFEGRMQAILDRSTSRDAVAWGRGIAITTVAVGLILPMAALQPEGQAQVVGPGNAGNAVALPATAEANVEAPGPSRETDNTTQYPPSPIGVSTTAPGTTPGAGEGTAAANLVQQAGTVASEDAVATSNRADTSVSATPSDIGSSSASGSASSSQSGSASTSQSSSSDSGVERTDP